MFTLIFIRSSAEYMDIIKGDFSKAASVRNMKVQIWFIKVSWRVAVVGVDGWDSHRTKAEAMIVLELESPTLHCTIQS